MSLGAVEFPLPPTRQERAVSDGSKNESRYRGRGRALSSGDSTYSHGSWSSADSSETLRRLRRYESGSVALEDQFCGWLWMRGTKFGRWRHRYFCLNGTVLSYFVTFPSEEFLRQASPDAFHFSDGTTPRGVLRVAHVEETISNIGFKVFGTCGRVIDIRAHRVDERNEWLRALKTPARRKSRSWSAGDAEDLTMSLASFDSDMTCTLDRHSIPVVKSGWMLKQSGVLKRWNKYFFVLQGKMLSYYASDKPYEVPRRRGYVQSVNVSRTSVGPNGFYPDLEVKLDGQLGLRMRLNSEDELEEWRMLLLECSTSPDASLYAIL